MSDKYESLNIFEQLEENNQRAEEVEELMDHEEDFDGDDYWLERQEMEDFEQADEYFGYYGEE